MGRRSRKRVDRMSGDSSSSESRLLAGTSYYYFSIVTKVEKESFGEFGSNRAVAILDQYSRGT